jgi:hypothetical protein
LRLPPYQKQNSRRLETMLKLLRELGLEFCSAFSPLVGAEAKLEMSGFGLFASGGVQGSCDEVAGPGIIRFWGRSFARSAESWSTDREISENTRASLLWLRGIAVSAQERTGHNRNGLARASDTFWGSRFQRTRAASTYEEQEDVAGRVVYTRTL